MSKKPIAKHAAEESKAPHLNLKARATSAIIAGCMAVSLCPAVAMAAQSGQDAPQANGNPPAMPQYGGDWGMPDWGGFQGGNAPGANQNDFQGGEAPAMDASGFEGAPQQDGSKPSQPDGFDQGGLQWEGASDGWQPPRADGADDQIRSILGDEYGLNTEFPGADGQASDGQWAPDENAQPNGRAPFGNPEDAPELGEGEVNVQRFIDNVRDAMRYCLENGITSDNLESSDNSDALSEYVTNADANRFKDVSDLPAPDSNARPSSDKQAGMNQAPASSSADAQAAESKGAPQEDASFLQQVISFVANLFGFGASA